jgi:hypothetical protein
MDTLIMTNLVVAFLEKPLSGEKILDLVNGIKRVYYQNRHEELAEKMSMP